MDRNRKRALLCLSLLSLAGSNLLNLRGFAASNETGSKGAEIYCFMRNNGNQHEVSWNASYALIKRQSNSLFKTSPTHAAVMITEAVVREPNKFNNCGGYLGDLFGEPGFEKPETSPLNKQPGYKENSENRYSY